MFLLSSGTIEGMGVNRPTSNRRFYARGICAIAVLLVVNGWLTAKAFNIEAPSLRFRLSAGDVVSALIESPEEVTWEGERTILILGRAGEGNNAPDLTDTIILAHADAHAVRPLKLITIPRDLLIQDEAGKPRKINALWSSAGTGEEGLAHLKETFTRITGLTVDRVVIFDLATVQDIIEKTGGVTVRVPDDIYDPRFPKTQGGYETFALQEGWRYLSAADALRFIRTRHSPRGDFDRMERQTELLRALKGKISTLNPVWDFGTLWEIYTLVQDQVLTDLTFEDARNLWILGKDRSVSEIETMSLGDSTLLETKMMALGGGAPASVVAVKGDPFDYTGIQKEITEFIQQ
jgi:LCP family protein required for cell wall assembly